MEILAHRVVWTLVFVLVVLLRPAQVGLGACRSCTTGGGCSS